MLAFQASDGPHPIDALVEAGATKTRAAACLHALEREGLICRDGDGSYQLTAAGLEKLEGDE